MTIANPEYLSRTFSNNFPINLGHALSRATPAIINRTHSENPSVKLETEKKGR
jgi:hypothetical protein